MQPDRVRRPAPPAVRRSAIRALAEQLAAVAGDLFTAIASNDADQGVRAAALMALDRRAGTNPEVRAFPTRRAAEEPSADLRHLVEHLLAR